VTRRRAREGVAAAVADHVAEEGPKNFTKSRLWRCCGSTGKLATPAPRAHEIELWVPGIRFCLRCVIPRRPERHLIEVV
jgi:hypothetical protein